MSESPFQKMFPQHGEGFIWEQVDTVENGVEATILVPESRKFYRVSFQQKGLDDNWRNWAIPTACIQWDGVGQRDASRPIPLHNVKKVQSASPVQPEYDTETKFRSVLIFPKRKDLVEYIGEFNAWSPYVGVVLCERSQYIERDRYTVGYVVRDRSTTASAFRVNPNLLKCPEGFLSDEDEQIWSGLEKEIECAKEEEKCKAKTSSLMDDQLLPVHQQTDHPELGRLDLPERRNNTVMQTTLPEYRWVQNRTEEEVQSIIAFSDYVKHKRFHEILVYKERRGERGFVGFTPLIGSIPITPSASIHKITGQRVEIGHNLNTRIEFIKLKKAFAVESVSEIRDEPFIQFTTRKNKKNGEDELLLHCTNLDLSTFTPLSESWKGRACGEVSHPDLQKILICVDQIGEWAGQRVSATLLHYEGMERETPGRIRLILEKIEGAAIVSFTRDGEQEDIVISGAPDEVDSDYSDDEEDAERPNSVVEKKAKRPPIPTTSVFYPTEITEEDYAEDTARALARTKMEADQQSQKQMSRYSDDRRSPSRDQQQGQQQHRYKDEQWQEKGGYDDRQQHSPRESAGKFSRPNKPRQAQRSPVERGILVATSRKSSLFYTVNTHKLAEYRGELSRDFFLGDSAEFEVGPHSTVDWVSIDDRSIRPIANILANEIMIKRGGIGEVIMVVKADLDRGRTHWECDVVNQVKLGELQTVLKLSEGGFVPVKRLFHDRSYYIHIRFDSDDLKWKFEAIDDRDGPIDLEPEDPIDIEKREAHEREKREREEREHPERNRRAHRNWSPSPERDQQSDRYSRPNEQQQLSRASSHYSVRTDAHQRSSRGRDEPISRAPSVLSCMSTATSATVTDQAQEKKKLQKKINEMKRMLKQLYANEEVRHYIEDQNSFLFQCWDEKVAEWEEEDEDERASRMGSRR